MKKIMLLLCLILALSACGGSDSSSPNANQGNPFIGGTQGVSIEFVENSPPAEVFDGGGSPFNVVVKLRNHGEYFVPRDEAVIELIGFPAQNFGLTPDQLRVNPPEDLIANTIDTQGVVVEGNDVYTEITNLNHVNPITGATFPYTSRAEVCYNYGFVATTKICVRKSITDPAEGGICEINEPKVIYNSASPVQVTSFRETPLATNKVAFQFDVQHLGTDPNGKVFEKDTACLETFRTFEDKIMLRVKSDYPIECTGLADVTSPNGFIVEGAVNLYGGKKPVHCNVLVEDRFDGESPITIEGFFGYRTSVETQIMVKHTAGI